MLVTQPYPTLCDPVDCSLPGSSVHGILQARILEWVAISSSTDLPHPEIEPQPPILQADSLVLDPPGIPIWSSSSALDFYPKKTEMLAWKCTSLPCSLQLSLQWPRYGSSLCPSMTEWMKRMWWIGRYTQWSVIQLLKNLKSCHLWHHG